jgi:hypothetical protein
MECAGTNPNDRRPTAGVEYISRRLASICQPTGCRHTIRHEHYAERDHPERRREAALRDQRDHACSVRRRARGSLTNQREFATLDAPKRSSAPTPVSTITNTRRIAHVVSSGSEIDRAALRARIQ